MNSLNRYAIAPGIPLKFNKDGSLDIHLQADPPGKDKEPNWLPTSPGAFNITIRNYYPKDEALNGTTIRRFRKRNEESAIKKT